MKGFPGQRGENGFEGSLGEIGNYGKDGNRGLKGMIGESGSRGERGLDGHDGKRGHEGGQGIDGDEGDKYTIPNNSIWPGYLYAIHNQSTSIPMCPPGMSKISEGYSLIFLEGNRFAYGQDLGEPGSCLTVFAPMPFLFCGLDNTCSYAVSNDFSYWLSTGAPMKKDMEALKGRELDMHISRCAICQSQTQLMAIHSFSTDPPECPYDWSAKWFGYSFVQVSGHGGLGDNQALHSPGSCLPKLHTNVMIQCHGRGTCNYFPNDFSYWLAVPDGDNFFAKPNSKTYKAGDYQRKISRCVVCAKRVSS